MKNTLKHLNWPDPPITPPPSDTVSTEDTRPPLTIISEKPSAS